MRITLGGIIVALASMSVACGGSSGGDQDGGAGADANGGGEIALIVVATLDVSGGPVQAIWSILDSGDVVRLTQQQPQAQKSLISPDGTTIAYENASSFAPWFVSARGDAEAQLSTHELGSSGFQWASDSSYVLFDWSDCSPTCLGRLSVVGPDGSGQVDLPLSSPGDAGVQDFARTSSESRVVFTTRASGEGSVHVVGVDGTGEQAIATGLADESPDLHVGPADDFVAVAAASEVYAWSPAMAWTKVADGSRVIGWAGAQTIVYVSGSDLRAVGRDGTGDHLIVAGATNGEVSPGGARVAYVAGSDVHTIAVDGSGDASLGAGGSYSWSTEGSYISFLSDRRVAGQDELYIAPADGSSVMRASVDPPAGEDVQDAFWSTDDVVLYYLQIAAAGPASPFTARAGAIFGTSASQLPAHADGNLPSNCADENANETPGELRDRVISAMGLDPSDYRLVRTKGGKLGTTDFTETFRAEDTALAFGLVCTAKEPFGTLVDAYRICCREMTGSQGTSINVLFP